MERLAVHTETWPLHTSLVCILAYWPHSDCWPFCILANQSYSALTGHCAVATGKTLLLLSSLNHTCQHYQHNQKLRELGLAWYLGHCQLPFNTHWNESLDSSDLSYLIVICDTNLKCVLWKICCLRKENPLLRDAQKGICEYLQMSSLYVCELHLCPDGNFLQFVDINTSSRGSSVPMWILLQKRTLSGVRMWILVRKGNFLHSSAPRCTLYTCKRCTPPLRLRCGFVGLRLLMPAAESDCGEVYTINNRCKWKLLTINNQNSSCENYYY